MCEEVFSERVYLECNPDVAKAVRSGALASGRDHYDRYGREEIRTGRRPALSKRLHVAWEYLRGKGLEIGALHNPLKVPASAKVRYVDRLSNEELRKHYPELNQYPLVPLDYVDDGEKLSSFAADSQDFIIANHFLEHCEDPIGTIGNFLRVLRQGGVVFLAVPDKRYTFDVDRELTGTAHFLADHRSGAEQSRAQHYLEWVRFVEPHFDRRYATEEAIRNQAQALQAMSYSIHYHVWDENSFRDFVEFARGVVATSYYTEVTTAGDAEIITVLRKGTT